MDDLFGDSLFKQEVVDVKAESRGVTAANYKYSEYRGSEDKNGFMLIVDLPGVPYSDVSLWRISNQLIVQVTTPDRKCTNRYTINVKFNAARSTATLVNGQLKVHMPFADADTIKTMRIPIVDPTATKKE